MAESKSTKSAEPDTQHTDADHSIEALIGTSSDAAHSTYSEAPAPKDAEYPPPGKQVEQTRGTPSEGGGTVFRANR